MLIKFKWHIKKSFIYKGLQGIKCTFKIKSPETPLFTEVSGDYAQMGKNVQCRSGMPIPIDFAGGDVSFLHLIIF